MRNAERIAADRQRITDGDVLGILMDHVRGKVELSQSQVNTGFGLLKKILPDFSNCAPPRDGRDSRNDDDFYDDFSTLEDDDSSPPKFEIHIVDPKGA